MAPISYKELDEELWCCNYYLRNLCDEESFPEWPISQPVQFMRELLVRWEEEVMRKQIPMSPKEALKVLGLKEEQLEQLEHLDLREAYRKAMSDPCDDKKLEKIKNAYAVLASPRKSLISDGFDCINVLLLIKTQIILCRRHPQALSPYTYDAYPLLLDILKLGFLEKETLVVQEMELLARATELIYLTCLVSPRNGELLVKESGMDILLDLAHVCLKKVPIGGKVGAAAGGSGGKVEESTAHPTFSKSNGQILQGGVQELTLHCLHTISGLVASDTGREAITKKERFGVDLGKILMIAKENPRLAQYALETISRMAQCSMLQHSLIQSGIVLHLVELLFHYSPQVGGDIRQLQARLEEDEQAAKNVVAIMSVRSIGRLGGYLVDDLESPKNPVARAIITALLTPPLAMKLKESNGHDLLCLFHSDVHRPDIIWNASMRSSLLSFVEDELVKWTSLEKCEDVERLADFRYHQLFSQIEVGGVYIKLFLEYTENNSNSSSSSRNSSGSSNSSSSTTTTTTTTTTTSTSPFEFVYTSAQQFSIQVLQFIASGGINSTTPTTTPTPIPTTLSTMIHPSYDAGGGMGMDAGGGSGGGSGEGMGMMDALSSRRKMRIPYGGWGEVDVSFRPGHILLCLSALAVMSVSYPSELEFVCVDQGENGFPLLFSFLEQGTDLTAQESVLNVLYQLSTRNATALSIASYRLVGHLVRLISGLGQNITQSMAILTRLGNASCIVKVILETTCYVEILCWLVQVEVHVTDEEFTAAEELRLPSALLLRKMFNAPDCRHLVQCLLCRFFPLPLAICIVEHPEQAAAMFESNHCTPELIWDLKTRNFLRSALHDLLITSRKTSSTVPFSPPHGQMQIVDYSLVYAEPSIGNVYPILFLKNPTYPLRDPKYFLDSLLQTFTKECQNALQSSNDTLDQAEMVRVQNGLDILTVITSCIICLTQMYSNLFQVIHTSGFSGQLVDILASIESHLIEGPPQISCLRLIHALSRSSHCMEGFASKPILPVLMSPHSPGGSPHYDIAFILEAIRRVIVNYPYSPNAPPEDGIVSICLRVNLIPYLIHLISQDGTLEYVREPQVARVLCIEILRKLENDPHQGQLAYAALKKFKQWKKQFRHERFDWYVPGDEHPDYFFTGPAARAQEQMLAQMMEQGNQINHAVDSSMDSSSSDSLSHVIYPSEMRSETSPRSSGRSSRR